MTYAARLNENIMATAAESIAAAREISALAPSDAVLASFIEDARAAIMAADVEDEHDVEEALEAWEGIESVRDADMQTFIANAGGPQAMRVFFESFGRGAPRIEELCGFVEAATRQAVSEVLYGLA